MPVRHELPGSILLSPREATRRDATVGPVLTYSGRWVLVTVGGAGTQGGPGQRTDQGLPVWGE